MVNFNFLKQNWLLFVPFIKNFNEQARELIYGNLKKQVAYFVKIVWKMLAQIS